MYRSTITAVGEVPQSTAHFKYSTILRCAVPKLMHQNLCGTVACTKIGFTLCSMYNIVAVPRFHIRTQPKSNM